MQTITLIITACLWLAYPMVAITQPVKITIKHQYNNNDVYVMALTIWGEGRGESREGKIAIANTIKNRYTASTKYRVAWGKTIANICQHPYQFSVWNHNDPNRNKMLNVDSSNPQFKESLFIAKGVLSGEIKDNTYGATHYFNYYLVNPKWSSKLTHTITIGKHKFLR